MLHVTHQPAVSQSQQGLSKGDMVIHSGAYIPRAKDREQEGAYDFVKELSSSRVVEHDVDLRLGC